MHDLSTNNIPGSFSCPCRYVIRPVVPISEVIPSRGVRALEGEGRGLSHLEAIARGRLWCQLASMGIDRGAQSVSADLFAPIPSFCSSCDSKPRCHQSWTLI